MAAATCSFETLDEAVRTVVQTIQMGVPIARAELLDERQMEAVNRWSKTEYPVRDTLFFEFHGAFFALLDRALADLLQWSRGEYPAEVEYRDVAGVPAAIITPRATTGQAAPDRVLIHLHGGVYHGLNQGEIESLPVAVLGGFKVITLNYRQEPFHRYPAP